MQSFVFCLSGHKDKRHPKTAKPGCSLLFSKTVKHGFLTTYSESFSIHAHISGTLLRMDVLLDLEDLLETTKLLITDHLIPDIIHQ